MPEAPSNAQNSAQEHFSPLREWCYTVQIVGPSWAGTYSRSPLTGKGSSTADGRAVKDGGGIEGRITGGVVSAYTEADVREYLDQTYIQREMQTREDEDGNKIMVEVITHTYHLLTLEPRTIVSLY